MSSKAWNGKLGQWWERNCLAILWLLTCFILGIVLGSWLVDLML